MPAALSTSRIRATLSLLTWIMRSAALSLKPPPHALVSEIDRLAEHERAAPNNAVDAVRFTLADGLL